MSQSPKTSAATPDVAADGQPTVINDGPADAPVILTAQQVVFATAAARSPRPASVFRRLIDTIRSVDTAAQSRPTRQHHPQRISFLEQSRMAREMNRL